MSDIQKLKELMAKYHSVTKKKGYDDGGEVTSEDLAPYIPSAQEEANSGLPPGPQRASYIANKKYQAAHPAASGYANGGNVSLPWSQQDKEAFSAGARGEAAPSKSQVKTSKYQMGDAEDSTEKPVGQDSSYSKMFANTPKDPDEVQGLDDGGLVDDVLSGKNSSSENDDPIEQALTAPSDEDDDKDEVTIKAPKSEVKKDDDSDDEDELTLPSQKDAKLLDNTNPAPDNSDASVKDLLNSVATSGNQNNSGNRPLTLQDLKDAQAKDRVIGGIVGILGGSKAHQNYLAQNSNVGQLQQQQQLQSQNLTQQSAQMQNQLAQYKLADEKEKNDVNSPASLFAQSAVAGTYKQLGMAPPPGLNKLSASSIEQSPVLDRMLTAQSTNLTKQLIAQQRAAAMQGNQSNKQDQLDEKTGNDISNKLNSLTASSRSALGTAAKAKVSAQRLKDIVNDPNATNQDLQSAYADLNAIVSGNTTQSGSEHQAYNTLQNDLAQKLQYITSNPHAPDITAVKQHVANVADRMSAISDNVINQNTRTIQAGRSGWISRHPDQWKSLVEATQPANELTNRAPQSSGSSQLSSQDKQAIDWANNNPKDPRAQQILKLHGLQ